MDAYELRRRQLRYRCAAATVDRLSFSGAAPNSQELCDAMELRELARIDLDEAEASASETVTY